MQDSLNRNEFRHVFFLECQIFEKKIKSIIIYLSYKRKPIFSFSHSISMTKETKINLHSNFLLMFPGVAHSITVYYLKALEN